MTNYSIFHRACENRIFSAGAFIMSSDAVMRMSTLVALCGCVDNVRQDHTRLIQEPSCCEIGKFTSSSFIAASAAAWLRGCGVAPWLAAAGAAAAAAASAAVGT